MSLVYLGYAMYSLLHSLLRADEMACSLECISLTELHLCR